MNQGNEHGSDQGQGTHQINFGNGNVGSVEELKGMVGPGWGGILDRLVHDLFELGWDGTVLQVKEKFGGLRFYIGTGSREVFDRIEQAEDESLRMCEVCGEPGRIRSVRGWLKTVCDKHD